MKLWLSLPFFPPSEIVELAEHVERLGVTGIAISDHMFVPEHQASAYPYSRESAELPFGSQLPDPVVTIAAAGARTTALRFMTYVLLVPLRHLYSSRASSRPRARCSTAASTWVSARVGCARSSMLSTSPSTGAGTASRNPSR
jgi:hypothetical protein